VSTRTLSVLQWLGVLGPPLVWTAQHVIGYGLGEARCSAAQGVFQVHFGVSQLTLMACAGLVVVVSELAAVAVFRRTRGADVGDGPLEDDRFGGEPPFGRLHFFASAAIVANVLFLTIMLLDGTLSSLDTLCRQS
jgi:hypothetical protein